ncbi:hypothetical protein [Halopelagius inordinatus]
MHRGVTFVLYQLTLMLGILMMPVALFTRRLGVTLPVNRLVDAAGTAYERASAGAHAQSN